MNLNPKSEILPDKVGIPLNINNERENSKHLPAGRQEPKTQIPKPKTFVFGF